ncbi:YqzG/YhdC family protein [Lederbergia wuyishanensis]|uniref:DUF3889 domain-containing protein n=1 Tax=Lederbergia wuyishanensis TaxID=1347903 RepID=A0ABU0D2W8_9BACI|nr:YqzG/YhdC family protein [Lederbergia wuyishanensis]MCJ8007116.1 YqzG/YhdC family protein [Lederbergia wuyishanensis]MDQ0342739.1 hypothetical protein [Lederbergia wuyishanensis]
MKKLLIGLFTTFIFGSNVLSPLNFIHTVSAQQKPIPSYAKWGVLAMKKTKERYPNARIMDYLHIGKLSGTPTSTEHFKFWLKEDGKEFGVYVNIEFNNRTEQIINITFRESPK